MTQRLPPKKDVALALLERSNVDVYLDPRAQGVVVPPQFRKESQLILKIGLNMYVPIPDLRFDEEGMSCTLSFSRVPFFCVVPWSSVFAMRGEDGRGMVWPDDVPRELSVKVVDEDQPGAGGDASAPQSAGGTRARGRSKLTDASAPRPNGPRAVSSESGDTRKRPRKKKKDDERPMLMAVPPPAPSEAQMTKAAKEAKETKAAEDSSVEASSSPSVTTPLPVSSSSKAAPPPSKPSDAVGQKPSSRPKRELPPYLRVVK